jgi:hypothetical protein
VNSFLINIFNNHKTVFYCLLSFDALVLVLHLILGNQNHFFHLDFEQNLPTVYQSLKLIIFGGIFFVLGLKKSIKLDIKSFILPLSLVLVFLGLDELLQIHENIYRIFESLDLFHPSKIVEASMKMGYRSSLWILYYLPFIVIFVFWSGYWLRYFQSKMKNNTWVLIISSLSLFTVLLTEILSSTGSFSETTYFWLVTLEESAEMLLASTLILIGSKVLDKHI